MDEYSIEFDKIEKQFKRLDLSEAVEDYFNFWKSLHQSFIEIDSERGGALESKEEHFMFKYYKFSITARFLQDIIKKELLKTHTNLDGLKSIVKFNYSQMHKNISTYGNVTKIYDENHVVCRCYMILLFAYYDSYGMIMEIFEPNSNHGMKQEWQCNDGGFDLRSGQITLEIPKEQSIGRQQEETCGSTDELKEAKTTNRTTKDGEGDVSIELSPKLLRLLQEHGFIEDATARPIKWIATNSKNGYVSKRSLFDLLCLLQYSDEIIKNIKLLNAKFIFHNNSQITYQNLSPDLKKEK